LAPVPQDAKLAREMQALFASPYLRVNTTTDVTGVEICGALKNVLALAAGIVEGLDLGNNAMAALVAQGCSEIRWLAEKMGARPATISGLSGLGDIMLTCYGSLSRNRRAPPACMHAPHCAFMTLLAPAKSRRMRVAAFAGIKRLPCCRALTRELVWPCRSVGVRLGRGEALSDILASSSQVAEGVATAGVVVGLGRTYRVSLPVLTAVAQVCVAVLEQALLTLAS
jgi:glycerol-3-phosphate dehydrogenase (NAD+)